MKRVRYTRRDGCIADDLPTLAPEVNVLERPAQEWLLFVGADNGCV